MSFTQKAQSLFPSAVWTGQSSIHTSIARSGDVPYGMDDSEQLMAVIMKSDIAAYMFRVVEKNCPGMEWLLPPEAFDQLIKADLYNLLTGKATTITKYRLKNPFTGNYFHRITLMEEQQIVGGIRVWLSPVSSHECSFGFRFRLEEMEHSNSDLTTSQKARQHAEALVEQLEPVMIEIKEYVASTVVEMPKVFEEYLPL